MAGVRPWTRGTAAARAANATVPAAGEIGVETDTGSIVVSDGTTAWQSLKRLVRKDEFDAQQVALNAITADPTNAVTSIWVKAKDFDVANTSSPLPAFGTIAQRINGWVLGSSLASPSTKTPVAQYVSWFGRLPSHWSTAFVDVIWANLVANTGVVSFNCEVQHAGSGESFNAAPTGLAVVPTANATPYVITTSTPAGTIVVTPTKWTTLRVSRNAASGSDTLPNGIVLLGVMLRKAS